MPGTSKIAVLAYNQDERVQLSVQMIRKWAQEHDFIQMLWAQEIPESIISGLPRASVEQMRQAEVMISIGGDGTFLSAARMVTGLRIPILGVHTGKTGFLTDFPVEKLEQALDQIAQGSYETRPRMMMEIERKAGDFYEKDVVLNELLISPLTRTQMVNLAVEINGRYLTDYWADSLLISTPTGSTAYNLSAGGPILYPSTEAFILTAVNPPSLSVRPLVIPATASMIIRENENQGCALLLDGRIEKFMNPGEEIVLRRSPWDTYIVHLTEYGFVDALREKLGWCGNFRNTRGTDGC